jgi:hypothetical protein
MASATMVAAIAHDLNQILGNCSLNPTLTPTRTIVTKNVVTILIDMANFQDKTMVVGSK